MVALAVHGPIEPPQLQGVVLQLRPHSLPIVRMAQAQAPTARLLEALQGQLRPGQHDRRPLAALEHLLLRQMLCYQMRVSHQVTVVLELTIHHLDLVPAMLAPMAQLPAAVLKVVVQCQPEKHATR